MNISECPVEKLSLYSIIKQYVEAGIIEERVSYSPEFGKVTSFYFDGERVSVRRNVVGPTPIKDSEGQKLVLTEVKDVAYTDDSKKLVCLADAMM